MISTPRQKVMVAISALAVLGTLSAPLVAYAEPDNTTITATVNSAITVASSGAVGLTLTPDASARLTSASDTVTVNTNNSGGYTLTLADTDSTLTLDKGGDSIAVVGVAPAAAEALGNNEWGWAVAGLSGFDASYSVESNASSSSSKWASIPADGAAFTLKTTATTASNDATAVWYAAKVDNTKPTGNYTNDVVYTATAN